jgi:hypothetical protein
VRHGLGIIFDLSEEPPLHTVGSSSPCELGSLPIPESRGTNIDICRAVTCTALWQGRIPDSGKRLKQKLMLSCAYCGGYYTSWVTVSQHFRSRYGGPSKGDTEYYVLAQVLYKLSGKHCITERPRGERETQKLLRERYQKRILASEN